jgi:NADH:ubiquinone oxidoreductase subunit 6 (subunit J)
MLTQLFENLKNLGGSKVARSRAQCHPAVYLGITMLAFGALNFAIGISMLGERGARNRVRCAT